MNKKAQIAGSETPIVGGDLEKMKVKIDFHPE